jgi:hypothetical protein
MFFFHLLLAQVTDFVQKQLLFLEQNVPEHPILKLFIGKGTDTE